VRSEHGEVFPSASDLPLHSDLVDALRREVEATAGWRWLELSCSLASGRGDRFSDIDAGIGHEVAIDDLAGRGSDLVHAIAPTVDVLVHADEAWPPGIVRLAVEYRNGVQLDLVLMPSTRRPGLPDGALAVVDKDGLLAQPWTPPVATATAEQAREWVMLGWWALSNTAKYLQRQSLFEAIESLHEARRRALRLYAVANRIPYPSFGLVSLLDFEPFDLPHDLESTYSLPDDPTGVLGSALAVADLLDSVAEGAGDSLAADLATPWATVARSRLGAIHRAPKG
jgi:hypothetical protein